MARINKLKSIAENEYKQNLKVMTKILGKGSTTNHELHKVGKQLFKHNFGGVFSADQIDSMDKGKYFIVNLDDSDEKGSHWIAVARRGKHLLVYDSFGRRLLKILPELLDEDAIIIESEHDSEQKDIEENCGQRCLSFLMVYDKLGYKAAKWI
jgi:hypothetical protein